MVGVKLNSWDRTRIFSPEEFERFVREVDWARTMFVAHHTHFDGMILTHHYGVYPAMWACTLSMSRLIFGVDVAHGLDDLSKRLGRQGKLDGGKALLDLEGVRDLSPEQYDALAVYNVVDVDELEYAYYKMRSAVPDSEMQIIDTTIAMYTEPMLQLDAAVTLDVQRREATRKQLLLDQTVLTKQILGSNKKFAEFLVSRGVDPPVKISPRTKELTFAFAKNDLEFQELLDHPDDVVSAAVEARLGTKGSLVETRSTKMLTFAGQPMPIYLAYWAARTGRWGGGDRCNWQNLPRDGLGAELRRAIAAMPGYVLIPSDARQIEARLVAWRSGQQDILDLFAVDADVYSHNASAIYDFTVDKDNYPHERFVGKVFTLGAGFGAGAAKMTHMLRSGQMGPKVDVTLPEVEAYLSNWRYANRYIVAHWRYLNEIARAAFLGQTTIEDGVLVWEGCNGDGYIHLPNNTYIRYRNVQRDTDSRDMYYDSRKGPVKLYGGILEENTIQALARVIFVEHINKITSEMRDVRVALLVHDDVVSAAPKAVAKERAARINQIMSTPPVWASGLPLNAETKISKVYGKA